MIHVLRSDVVVILMIILVYTEVVIDMLLPLCPCLSGQIERLLILAGLIVPTIIGCIQWIKRIYARRHKPG